MKFPWKVAIECAIRRTFPRSQRPRHVERRRGALSENNWGRVQFARERELLQRCRPSAMHACVPLDERFSGGDSRRSFVWWRPIKQGPHQRVSPGRKVCRYARPIGHCRCSRSKLNAIVVADRAAPKSATGLRPRTRRQRARSWRGWDHQDQSTLRSPFRWVPDRESSRLAASRTQIETMKE